MKVVQNYPSRPSFVLQNPKRRCYLELVLEAPFA